MTGHDLLDAMEGIDTRYIEDAAVFLRRKRPLWLRVTAAAACVCVLACGVWQATRWYTMQSAMSEGDTVRRPQEAFATSETYETLTDLLEGLKDGETHPAVRGEETEIPVKATDTAALTEGQNAVVYNGYSYHLAHQKICISALTGATPQAVGEIGVDQAAVPLRDEQNAHGDFTSLFLHGDHLIAVNTLSVGGAGVIDRTVYTAVTVYSLADPATPAVLHRFVQLGSLTHVYMAGDKLTVMTADGVCACGWSRLKNTEDYVPHLTVDGESVAWGEERLHVLGAPTMVQYLAVAQIDLATATVTDRRAFYGEIHEVYYGADWFVLNTVEDIDTLYTFSAEDVIRYTGAITMPDQEFADTTVLSVAKADDVYRVIAKYRTGRGGNTNVSLLGLTANTETGESYYRLMESGQARSWTFSEVCWEKDRAVVVTDGTVLFAEFYGTAVRLYASSFEAQAVDSVGGAKVDKTLIDLSDGHYLRFTADADGLEWWDLTRSGAPEKAVCETLLTQGDRFADCWTVYDRNTVGIAVVTSDENGKYYHGNVQWHLYRLDRKAKTFERLATYDLQTDPDISSSYYQFASFVYNDQYYITTADLSVPLTVSWQ